MPTLNFIGKDKIINNHKNIPIHFLDKKYTYTNNKTINSENNMLIHGDNLIVLKSLLSEYQNKIDCIYIDPPYNIGNEIKQWLNSDIYKKDENSCRHDRWLSMMYPRLQLLQQLLSENGVIFISIDDNELFNLKLICDEIFGSDNFVANFVVNVVPNEIDNEVFNLKLICDEIFDSNNFVNDFIGNVNPKDRDYVYISKMHEYILMYAKNIEKTVTHLLPEKMKIFKYKDDVGCFNIYPLYIKSILSDIKFTYRKGSDEIEEIFSNKIYNFSKPIELLKNLIQISTKKGSIILDSFFGSGALGQSVLELNQQDGFNRKFIGIEMLDYAESISATRIKKVIDGYNNKLGTGGSFDYYEIGEEI